MLIDCTVFARAWARRVSRGDAGGIASGAGRRPKPLRIRPFGSTGEARVPRCGCLTMPPASPAQPRLTRAPLRSMQLISITRTGSSGKLSE